MKKIFTLCTALFCFIPLLPGGCVKTELSYHFALSS